MSRLILMVATAFACAAIAPNALAAFHLMQIELVAAGVDGDTDLQAVQLRMRSGGQTQVSGRRLVAYDAQGSNPITLITFDGNLANGQSGSRILATTAEMAAALTITPDFILDNAIPADYLDAGKVAFQSGDTIYWSVSWGGTAYTGSQSGQTTNDFDGDFGPAIASGFSINGADAFTFTDQMSTASTTNLADYSLINHAVLTNNEGEKASIPTEKIFADGFEIEF